MRFIYFFTSLILASNLLAQKAPDFEHIKLSLNSKKVNHSDIIDHIEIIRLEETKGSLISNVSMFVKLPEGFAIADKNQKKVFLFNSQGKYLSSIYRYGDGPTSYSGFSSVWLKNNAIELFNSDKRELFRFGLDGKYLNHKKLKIDKTIRLGQMSMLDDGYVISTIENISLNGRVETAGYSLIILDKDLKVVDQKLKNNYIPPFPHGLSLNLIKEDNAVLFKNTLNDTLYYASKNKVTPYLHLDFNENWAWGSKGKKPSMNEAFAAITRGSKVYEIFPVVSPKKIAIEYWINRERKGFGLLNRSTGQFLTLKGNSGDLWFQPLQWKGNILIATMASYQIDAFLKTLKQEQWQIKGDFDLEEVLSSENPVILKIKFKKL